jgi:hypothetical protein
MSTDMVLEQTSSQSDLHTRSDKHELWVKYQGRRTNTDIHHHDVKNPTKKINGLELWKNANELDCRCKRRQRDSGKTSCPYTTSLNQTIYNPNPHRNLIQDRIIDIKDQEEEPIGESMEEIISLYTRAVRGDSELTSVLARS